jgi:co-chaperonin GroES (HSP10)
MSEIVGGGDKLARGAKTATFSGGYGEGELKPSLAAEGSIPDVVDNSALFAAKKPQTWYKGKPFYGRVLVVPVDLKSNTTVIIPDSAKDKSEVGRIAAFSADSKLKEWGLELGALILFDRFAAVGQSFPLLNQDGENIVHLLLQECDVQMELIEVQQPEESSMEEVPQPCSV